MIKTIVIVNDFDYVQGGASQVAIDTACLLHNSGYKVIFFSGTHSDNKFIDYGYENVNINMPECLNNRNRIKGCLDGLYNKKAKKIFKQLLKKLDKDSTIIHYHGWTKTLSSSVFSVAFQMGFKTVLTLHDYFTACPNGGFFNYKKNDICKLTGNCKKCLITNCDSRNFGIKLYRNLRFFIQNKIISLPKKINNIIYISDFSWKILNNTFPNTVNATKINNPIKIPFHEKIDKLEKNKYYLYVGRVSKEKCVETFCSAITKTNLEGIVVGDGSEKDKLEKMYPTIKFVGWKNKNDVFKYMLSAKALIFTSKWYETAGLTAIEANSIGLPCIVRDKIATADFIHENKNGLIFKDDKDLIEKLVQYEKMTTSQLKNMKEYSIEFSKRFNNSKYKNQLLKFYEKILNDS